MKLDGCFRRRNVPGSITCWLQYFYSYSCWTDPKNSLRKRVTGSHLNFFIIRHIPVILYSRLLSLPELNEESRPQCHKYSEEYSRWVVNYIRRLNNIIPQVKPHFETIQFFMHGAFGRDLHVTRFGLQFLSSYWSSEYGNIYFAYLSVCYIVIFYKYTYIIYLYLSIVK